MPGFTESVFFCMLWNSSQTAKQGEWMPISEVTQNVVDTKHIQTVILNNVNYINEELGDTEKISILSIAFSTSSAKISNC